MARCPLCSERSAKRFCPAKSTSICAVCCGTKREIEIDCPASCSYLKGGQSYEDERKAMAPEIVQRAKAFTPEFTRQYGRVLLMLGQVLAEQRHESPWLLDTDAKAVYEALAATLKTLSSGIYYETLPDGPVRGSLFRKLKSVLDTLMTPGEADARVLKVSEALAVVDFLILAVDANTSGRPKSRRYLEWVSNASGLPEPAPETSRLILP